MKNGESKLLLMMTVRWEENVTNMKYDRHSRSLINSDKNKIPKKKNLGHNFALESGITISCVKSSKVNELDFACTLFAKLSSS